MLEHYYVTTKTLLNLNLLLSEKSNVT